MNYPVATAASDKCAASVLLLGLLQAARSVQDRLESTLEAIGLSCAKYQALDALVQAGEPLALSELAGCLKCVRSNVTQLADRLEADGLVRRVDDPSDRRAIRAVVTPLGIERHAAGAKGIAALQDWLDARVMPGDRDAVLRALSAIE
jgi:DNA-binding MarR family transcriptional regulator